ncbi:MAG TPA: hypothetical protein VK489_07835 [Ferruginibacter sp.]|nr:hypothetical protein [Ferruginibacter sp.]
MQDETFEIEKSLIEEYDNNLKIIRELELVKTFYSDAFSDTDKERLNSAHNSIDVLINKLQCLESKPATKTKVETLINQLKAIIDALKENPYGLSISRNQGLIFETAIYGMIISDITWAFHSYIHSWSNPYYYYDNEQNFDHSQLKTVLIDFRQSLISHQPDNFIELEKRVNQCVDNINELATEDYKQNILTR